MPLFSFSQKLVLQQLPCYTLRLVLTSLVSSSIFSWRFAFILLSKSLSILWIPHDRSLTARSLFPFTFLFNVLDNRSSVAAVLMVLGSNSPAVLLFFSICFPFHYYPINLYLSCISLSDSRSTFLSAFLHFFSLFTIRIILFLNFHILVPNCQVFILENCWTGQNILGHDYKRKRGELRSTDL